MRKIPITYYEQVTPADTMVAEPSDTEPMQLTNEGGVLYKVTTL